MRIGLMVGPERGRYRTKVDRMKTDARWAEEAGLATVWIPQIPDEFDALTAAAVVGAATDRIEVGTAVVPVQPRHPIALAQQVLSVQAVCEGRLAVGLGVSHHWVIDEMLGLPYERPVPTMRSYLDVLGQALAGPGPVDVENEMFRVHNPLDITDITPTPVLLAALGPRMLALCGARADGTILWMADERAIATHVVPNLTRAAQAANRPAPRVVAGIPVCLCRDDEVDAAVDADQPHPRGGRGLAQLPEAPRARRLPQRRGHPGRRERVRHRQAAPGLRRRRRDRHLGPGRADRGKPRGAHRLVEADPRTPGLAGVVVLTWVRRPGPDRHDRAVMTEQS